MHALDVWGGRFEMIYLGPFGESDSISMLKKLFAQGGMNIKNEDARIIAEAAGYHPFYMQYMGHKIFLSGSINRRTLREAKQKLFEFVMPIFIDYIKRIRKLGKGYINVLAKIIRRETLNVDDLDMVSDILRMGIIKPKNAEFEIVDPLFQRYLEQIINNVEVSEVAVVGHWAERIVGNYLVKKSYKPFYSHDSKGAFDIYVMIYGKDVGIQVKYSSTGKIYLSENEAKIIINEAKRLNWIPILALVSKKVKFFSKIRPGEYDIQNGEDQIEKIIEKIHSES